MDANATRSRGTNAISPAIEALESRLSYDAAPLVALAVTAVNDTVGVASTRVPWLSVPSRSTASAEAVQLFDGTEASLAAHWRHDDGAPARLDVIDGAMVVEAGTGNLRTAETFTDLLLHLEVNVPTSPAGAAEQDRGNSGVGLAGTYEIQVLDSFGRALSGANDMGAIYGVRDASTNAAFPAGTWQNLDVIFRAARWAGQAKLEPARLTAWLNGTRIHNNVVVPANTFTFAPESPGAKPLLLQDHGQAARFRNVWAEPLDL